MLVHSSGWLNLIDNYKLESQKMKDDTPLMHLPYMLYPNGRNHYQKHLEITTCWMYLSCWGYFVRLMHTFIFCFARKCRDGNLCLYLLGNLNPKFLFFHGCKRAPPTPSKEPMGMALVWFDIPFAPSCSSKAIKEWQPFFHSTCRGGLERNCFFSRGSRPGIRLGTFQRCAEHQRCWGGWWP